MEKSVTINASGCSFTAPVAVIAKLSPTLHAYFLSNQCSHIDLRGSRFTMEVMSIVRKYIEANGEPEITTGIVNKIHSDDLFVAVARAADELGLNGLLNTCTKTLTDLLNRGPEHTRGFFQIFNGGTVKPNQSIARPGTPLPGSSMLARSSSPLINGEERLAKSQPLPETPPLPSEFHSVYESELVDEEIDKERLTRSTFFSEPVGSQLNDFAQAVLLSKKESASVLPENQCHLCQKLFTAFDRRHHCRSCAHPVCGACSLYVELPKGYSPVAPQSYLTLALNAFDYSKHLICKQCEFCIDFGVIDFDIVYLDKASQVSKKWRQAALNYGREMLDIQYKLPYQDLSYRERRRLWTNRDYWIGHSKWCLQLLKSIDWSHGTESSIVEYIQAIEGFQARKTCCQDIWCSTRCTTLIDAGDALELLSEKVTNEHVREFAVGCLQRASDDKLACYLPILVNNLRWEQAPSSSSLWKFLLEKAFSFGGNVHSEFCNQLYWLLYVSGEGDRRLISLQQRLLVEIARKFGDRYALQLVKGLEFVTILESLPVESACEDIRKKLHKLLPPLNVSLDNPFRVPLNPEIQICEFLIDQVTVQQSSTRPILLPCKCIDGSIYRLLFKREDLRKDYIVISILNLMSTILRDNGLPLNILTYRVLPTSCSSGFIEIVPNASTIYDIEVKHKTTLQKYILERNREDVVGAIYDRFSSSMAGYSLACYILALGDRHKNNIMLTSDGTLFHIDYGYILGKDANLKSSISPYMRITQEMLECMGGDSSNEYKQFQERCIKGLSILRRWTPVFANILMFLTNAKPAVSGESLEQLKNIIHDRFRPDSLPRDASEALKNAMERSSDSTGGKVVDTFHRLAKASSVTFQGSSSFAEKLQNWWWQR